ncbi:bi-domain-containing oxidoreductase [bacterium]|nr:bi-domain-containing oxidoreductase [bacterium]
MLQIIQPINGQPTQLADLPDPVCGPGQVLIENRASLISAGTERSTVELAQQSLLSKARQRPDHVRRVMEKFRQEGLAATLEQVRSKLAQPIPMGYSSAGIVREVGAGVREFRVGERVASNGSHAGVVAVGKNLVARIPDEVPFEHAAYAVVSSIALQSIRLSGASLGDVVVVVGLGLIGQITVALLKSAGCRVVGTDVDPNKFPLAIQMGAEWVGSADSIEETLARVSPSGGADVVIIAASSASSAPLVLASRIARDRAKVVALGAVGLKVPRREFYEKELELIVSRSYGPGRYDASYEEEGNDYPISYVRWTEQRNIQAVLDQMAAGRLPVEHLTTHRFSIDRGTDAYSMIERASEPYLGIILTYSSGPPNKRVAITSRSQSIGSNTKPVGISFIGTGSFASSTLLPTLSKIPSARLRALVSARGLSAWNLAKRYGGAFAATDLQEALDDEQTQAVVVSTQHHLHVPHGLAALRAGKHLFLEKPLAINGDQLEEWIDAIRSWEGAAPIWMLGFNRRFSPAAHLVRKYLQTIDDVKAVTIRFNAGAIPASHWVHDPEVGGGRLVGEACHAVDLATFLIGSRPTRVYAEAIGSASAGLGLEDNAALQIRFADGSSASILYTSAGDRSLSKERVEVYSAGLAAVIDDYRRVEIRRGGKVLARRSWWSQQKGYAEEIRAFLAGIETGRMPISVDEMLGVTATCLRALQSLRMETPLEVDWS